MNNNNKATMLYIIMSGFVLVATVGVLDYVTGYWLSFSIFYLAPILIVTLLAGLWPGTAMAVISAIAWFMADYLSRESYPHPLIPYWNTAVRLAIFLVVVVSISKLKAALDREKELSGIDFLTGIMNSKKFYELAEMEIKRSERYKRPFSVAYLDCDNFKSVNDKFGHQMGDELLRKVATRIKNNTRNTDISARLGGDEFAIMMPETEEIEAEEIITRLKTKLSNAMEKSGWLVTFSIGLATFTLPPDSVDEVIKEADSLMYSAKKNGKDNIKRESIGKNSGSSD